MTLTLKPEPRIAVTRKQDGKLALDYNVQLVATGRWFNVRKTTDANGVVWMQITEVSQ